MRYHQIIEKKAEPEMVPWPTNLAWRIRFRRFAGIEYFRDFRRSKAFAMPFRNWENTYQKLTGKDTVKLRYMPTEVIEVADDAMVGEMDLIDEAFSYVKKNDPTGAMRRRADEFIDEYERTMVPYAQFRASPSMFTKPEIMVDRAAMKVLPLRVIPIWDREFVKYRLGVRPTSG